MSNWKIKYWETEQCYEVTNKKGFTIAHAIRSNANAKLIASTPELLATLERLADYAERVAQDICDQDTGWFYQFGAATDKARNAINKAKDFNSGKTQTQTEVKS